MHMLDSDQEPQYNLSKNLLLQPRILKLMKDMVEDSTPCLSSGSFLSFFKFRFSILVQVNTPTHFFGKPQKKRYFLNGRAI